MPGIPYAVAALFKGNSVQNAALSTLIVPGTQAFVGEMKPSLLYPLFNAQIVAPSCILLLDSIIYEPVQNPEIADSI